MSYRTIGYENGRPVHEDLGPSRARVTGYGGSLVTHAITPKPPPKRLPRQELGRLKRWQPPCLSLLARTSEPCQRTQGHSGHHASAKAMRNLEFRRRMAL